MITRKEAQAVFGGNPRALAIFLEVHHTTVAHWDMDTRIPKHHQRALVMEFPEHFPAAHEAVMAALHKARARATAHMQRAQRLAALKRDDGSDGAESH